MLYYPIKMLEYELIIAIYKNNNICNCTFDFIQKVMIVY